MIWLWLLLGAGALYEATKSLGTSAPGAFATKSSSADIGKAVRIALAIETDPTHLTDFAKALQASYPAFAEQLNARAQSLSSPSVVAKYASAAQAAPHQSRSAQFTTYKLTGH